MSEPSDTRWHGRHWDLPPLILHPFGGGPEGSAALDSIRLTLYLSGIGEPGVERERLIRGRYIEFRMLCLVGKDVMRWIAQCADFASRDAVLAQSDIRPQSFADLLVNRAPTSVAARFESWGVSDFRRIAARAIGLNAVFPSPPGFNVISTEFLEQYYAYADVLFACYLSREPFIRLEPQAFAFSLYTSDEYLSTLKSGDDELA